MRELDFDFCLKCGTCIASCPVDSLQLEEEGPSLNGKCIACGLCYSQCPQFVSTEESGEQVFKEDYISDGIGVFEEGYSVLAKNSEISEKGQDGGAITALLTSLIEEGFIDGAVLAGIGDEPWNPEPKVAVTGDEIIECAGTIYTRAAQSLGVEEAVKDYGLKEMAVVGTPCQIRALRRMTFSDIPIRKLGSKIKLLIGLFCTEAFPYPDLKKFVEEEMNTDLEEIKKMDIDKGNFILYLDGENQEETSIGSMKKYASTPCHVCDDFSAELADISVGSVGAPSGHSAVLLRTQVGIEAFERAQKSENLEYESIEDVKPGIGLIEKLSSKKRDNAHEEIENRKEDELPLPPNAK